MASRTLWVVVVLVLALVAGTEHASAAASDPDLELKGEVSPDHRRPAVPASSEWSMFIMVLLVLTTSTFVFMGDGFFPGQPFRRPAVPRPAMRPPTSGPQLRGADDHVADERPKRAARVPKSTLHREETARQRRSESSKGWSLTRRNAPHAGARRRSGPGCRGVR